ncbi:MAG: integrase [Ruminococcaceae bacterium]|nr:integrase [Oscillospiraceae bacterium]
MKESIIREIEQAMLPYLDNAQLKKLHSALNHSLWNKQITIEEPSELFDDEHDNTALLEMFLSAKQVEGCSEKTLRYYRTTIVKMLSNLEMGVTHITTDELRQYLADYEQDSECSKANIDNIRRILSSFFSWLEDENYILKSPVRRIHKIKTTKPVKETYTDETLEIMRDNCENLRDLAIIDMLASTGMRVGELVKLNIADVDFDNRECVVLGKGSKERPVYFDARTKIHLKNYLLSRTDDNPALFVSLLKPFNRLEISGVEIRLRTLGRKLNIPKVHPHKFRRTLATRAIDKGMPIEQVQKLLGHTKIDTTMEYAMVSQNNVKISHRRYIG